MTAVVVASTFQAEKARKEAADNIAACYSPIFFFALIEGFQFGSDGGKRVGLRGCYGGDVSFGNTST